MLKSKILRGGLAMFMLGTFGLFSCSQNASIATNVNPADQTGSVEVTLPDLSNSGLAKSALLLDANALNLFITGANMDTIKYSWPINSLKGQRVQINGIPAGKERLFTGFLTDKAGIVTHMGKVPATIIAGTVVQVVLKLSATGSVNLCIEIEGYPTSCSGTDTAVVNSCIYLGIPGISDAKISFRAVRTSVTGYFTFTDTMAKWYYIEKCSMAKDSLGYKYYDCTGYSKETGINARFEIFVKGNSIPIGYVYNLSTKQTMYKFYTITCPQQDTIVLSGKLNAYMYQSSTQDTGVVKFYMMVANGYASGNLSLYNPSTNSVLDLRLQGSGKFESNGQYGEIFVSTPDTTGCTYTLGMSFSKSGEMLYCKGSLDRKGTSCSSGPVATIFGNL